MPYGAIGDADVGLGDSVIMVPDSQGEEYKPMQSGIHLYVEDWDAIYKPPYGNRSDIYYGTNGPVVW